MNERLLHLLPGDRLWDCTANLFLHRRRSATLGKTSRIECLFQLVTAQPVPPARVGPALGYTLNLFWFNILFMLISKNNMNRSTFFVHTLPLFYTVKLLVIFGIKIYRKLPSYLTGSVCLVLQVIKSSTDVFILDSTFFLAPVTFKLVLVPYLLYV